MINENKNIAPYYAKEHALAFLNVHKYLRSSCLKPKYSLCCWKPPPQEVLKLNVDDTNFSDQKIVSVGGSVLMATSKIEKEVSGQEEIELFTMFRGLQLCLHMGIHYLIVESDFGIVRLNMLLRLAKKLHID